MSNAVVPYVYSKGCIDKDNACPQMASSGYCTSYKDYMAAMCPKSCKKCKWNAIYVVNMDVELEQDCFQSFESPHINERL